MVNNGRIEEFEDLVAWQKARALTRAVYLASQKGSMARDYGLAGQMQRASVSIMANIAEGFERSGTAEFLQFLNIAKASAAELRSHIYVAQDVGYLDEQAAHQLLLQAREVSRIISGLRASVQRRSQSSPTTRSRPNS